MTNGTTIFGLAVESIVQILFSPTLMTGFNSILGSKAAVSNSFLAYIPGVSALGNLLLVCLVAILVLSTARAIKHARPRTHRQKVSESGARLTNQILDESRILAAFVHDVRRPVITALGSFHRAQAVWQVPTSETISKAITSLEAALRITDDALELVSLSTDTHKLHPTPADLKHVLLELHKEFAPKARRKDLGFEFYVDETLPHIVKIDRVKVMRVLSHLLEHAITGTRHGQVSLSVKIMKAAKGTVTLAFSITDTGPGIAKQDQKDIFTAFGQLDKRHDAPGSGLGLLSWQQMLICMGAEIHLDSRPGVGTTVSFQLQAEAFGTDSTEGAPPRCGH